jgi:hemerythrin-like metal-binding protein
MPSRWDAKLTTGIPTIDTVHFELLGIIDESLNGREGLPTVSRAMQLLDLLDSHVLQHFLDEEEQMLRWDYPEMLAHRVEHGRLADFVADLRREVRDRPGELEPLVLSNRLLCSWLFTHIHTSDRELAEYLRARRRRGRTCA